MKSGSILMPEMPQASPAPSLNTAWPRTLPEAWLLLPAMTGGLLWLCFYPMGWGFLGWAALVPFLFTARLMVRPWIIYTGSFIGGCLFFWATLSWMTVADYRMVYLWGMLATYCALYFPLALFLIRRLDRSTSWPLTITAPLVWTVLEFLRSFFGTGFAWYFLGHSQHHYLPVIQVADLGGVYLISFVMAAVNGWLVEYLSGMPEVRRFMCQDPRPRKFVRRFGRAVAAMVVGLLAYGGWRVSQDSFLQGPTVALLQGNLDQRFRDEAMENNQKGIHTREEIEKYYRYLCGRAMSVVPPPDLLVWPETSYPFPWIELPEDLNSIPIDKRDTAIDDAAYLQSRLRDLAKKTTNQLFGLPAYVWNDKGKMHPYNSALLLDANGKNLGRYDKIHRVPFGEYVPLKNWLPFLSRFVPFDSEWEVQRGEKMTRFPLGKYHFGVLICYEDTDPFLARQYGHPQGDGPAVDFLINMSNDGWFDGSNQHAEHLAISRFRAVETRRAVARAVNMGISAVIDSNGQVLKPVVLAEYDRLKIWQAAPQSGELPEELWCDFTKVDGILVASIPIDNRFSLYAWTGDWLPCGCFLVMVGVWLQRRRKLSVVS
jgi:apolipoprotein N-acyltransferase